MRKKPLTTPKIPGPPRYPFVDNNLYFVYKGCVQKASSGYMDTYGDIIKIKKKKITMQTP
jgi:hypothetical protein